MVIGTNWDFSFDNWTNFSETGFLKVTSPSDSHELFLLYNHDEEHGGAHAQLYCIRRCIFQPHFIHISPLYKPYLYKPQPYLIDHVYIIATSPSLIAEKPLVCFEVFEVWTSIQHTSCTSMVGWWCWGGTSWYCTPSLILLMGST